MTYKLNQSDHFISINGIIPDASLANSEANIHLDTTSKDIKIKYKDDTGTVRTVLIGESTAYVTGQILFGDTDGSITSDSELFWNNTDKTLGVGGTPGATAKFIVNSTTRGSRPAPRMTEAQRDAISTPSNGLMIYNTDTNSYNYYDSTAWVSFGSESTTLISTTVSGVWAAPQNIDIRIGFISDTQVSISFQEVVAAATTSNSIVLDTALPAAFRPLGDKTAIIKVADNGANMVGQCLIPSSGLVTINTTVDNSFFTGSGTTGFKSFSMVYDVAL